jgi:hypothetical protein
MTVLPQRHVGQFLTVMVSDHQRNQIVQNNVLVANVSPVLVDIAVAAEDPNQMLERSTNFRKTNLFLERKNWMGYL